MRRLLVLFLPAMLAANFGQAASAQEGEKDFLSGVPQVPSHQATPEISAPPLVEQSPGLQIPRDDVPVGGPEASAASTGWIALPADSAPSAPRYRPTEATSGTDTPTVPNQALVAAKIDTQSRSTVSSTSERKGAVTLPPVVDSAVTFFSAAAMTPTTYSQQIFNPNGRGYIAADAFPNGLKFESCGVYFFDFVYSRGTLRTDSLSTTTLEIAADANHPFTIVLSTYNGAGNAGALPSAAFDPSQARQWTLVAADQIQGYNRDAFTIDASRFMSDTAGGAFSVDQVGANLVLNFTPVPEPQTWIMLGSGMAFVAAFSLRRRRRA